MTETQVHKSKGIISTKDDLRVKPEAIKNFDKIKTVAQGDLHGNTVKLLHFLIQYGVVELSKQDYEVFFKAYYAVPQTKENFDTIIQLIDKCQINSNSPYLRFIGDELADRGVNDYYTLYFFKKMDESGVQFDIYQSNHSADFALAYENRADRAILIPPVLQYDHCTSLHGLNTAIDAGWVSKEALSEAVSAHKQHQKLIGYSISEAGNLSIYSHAPIGFSMIEALALKLRVQYNASSETELAQTLDCINQTYRFYLESGMLAKLIDIKTLDNGYRGIHISMQNNPVEYLFWNRDYSNLDRVQKAPNGKYQLNYIHGHDSRDIDAVTNPHIFCVDSNFGKFAYNDCWTDENPIYFADEYSLQPALKQHQSLDYRLIPKVQSLQAICDKYLSHLENRLSSTDSDSENTAVQQKIASVSAMKGLLDPKKGDMLTNKQRIHDFKQKLDDDRPMLQEKTAPWKAFLRDVAIVLSKIFIFGFFFADPNRQIGKSHGMVMTERCNQFFNNEDMAEAAETAKPSITI